MISASILPKGALLAVDKLDPQGAEALQSRGLHLTDSQMTELARAISDTEEIKLMRWTIRVCEAGMARIYENSLPGTQRDLWAHLHYENARSGGDWLETKLLTAGANTNPWYQECSDYVVKAREMISFDTDMIGPYGYCADISRSWICGYHPMNPDQRRLYRTALDQDRTQPCALAPRPVFCRFQRSKLAYRCPPCRLPLFAGPAWGWHGRRMARGAAACGLVQPGDGRRICPRHGDLR